MDGCSFRRTGPCRPAQRLCGYATSASRPAGMSVVAGWNRRQRRRQRQFLPDSGISGHRFDCGPRGAAPSRDRHSQRENGDCRCIRTDRIGGPETQRIACMSMAHRDPAAAAGPLRGRRSPLRDRRRQQHDFRTSGGPGACFQSFGRSPWRAAGERSHRR
jgi:hypothetical protein